MKRVSILAAAALRAWAWTLGVGLFALVWLCMRTASIPAPWLVWLAPAAVGVLIGTLAQPIQQRKYALVLVAGLRVFASAIVLLLVGCGVGALLLSDERSEVQPAPVSPLTESRVHARIAELNPLRANAEQPVQASFDPAELQTLAQLLLRRFDPDVRVRVVSEPWQHALGWSADLRLPRLPMRPYAQASGSIALLLRDGRPELTVCRLRFGLVPFPDWVCREVLAGWYRPDAVSTTTLRLGALDALQVDERGAAVAYRRFVLDETTRQALQRLLGPGDVIVAAVRAQLSNLRQHAVRLQHADDRFRAAMQTAFQLARIRAQVGDPVAENQGAILALAMVFGDAKVALAAGLARDPSVPALAERIGPVHLWGRSDWAQHFLVSAAFAQVLTARGSDVAGLVKEQLDADGGSGFSFTDLLADRAGIAFGRRLAADAIGAREVQDQLVDHWRIEDFAPSPIGLPEGMQADEFVARYGAVGSPEYRRVEAEIDRRLRTARLLALCCG